MPNLSILSRRPIPWPNRSDMYDETRPCPPLGAQIVGRWLASLPPQSSELSVDRRGHSCPDGGSRHPPCRLGSYRARARLGNRWIASLSADPVPDPDVHMPGAFA